MENFFVGMYSCLDRLPIEGLYWYGALVFYF